MRKLFLSLCLLSMAAGLMSQEKYKLTLEIKGIKKVKGKLGVCLLNRESEFLSDCSNYKEFPVTANSFEVAFEDVEPGEYAITAYHDANSNGELDTNFFGIPKERYGFSNNPKSTFGPPGYSKCLFTITGDMSMPIRMK